LVSTLMALVFTTPLNAFANVKVPSIEVRVTVAPDGQSVIGRAVSAANGILDVIVDRQKGITHISVDSILSLETRGAGHSQPTALAAGLGVGVASFVALFYATFAACGDDNSRCINRAAPLMLGVPAAAGGVVGYLVRYKGRHPLSLEQLHAMLQRAARKKQP